MFDGERRLRASGPAVGCGRSGVGEDRMYVGTNRGGAIHACQPAQVDERGKWSEVAQIRAHRRDHADPQRHEPAVAVEGEFDLHHLVASVVVGEVRFGPIPGPLHRPTQLARRPQHERHLRKDARTQPERAAHVGAHHPQLRLRDPEHVTRDPLAHRVDVLQPGMERVAPVRRVVASESGTRLHRVHAHPGDRKANAGDVRRPHYGGLHGLRVSEPDSVADVVGTVLPDRRRSLGQRLLGGGHHGQRLVLDLDEIGRIARPGGSVGHHERHAVADERDLPGLKRETSGLEYRRAVRTGERRGATRQTGQGTEAVRFDIRAGEDRSHAGRRQGLHDFDARDSRMRMRRTNHAAVELIRQVDVVGEATPAAQQAMVLDPRHGLSNSEFHGSCDRNYHFSPTLWQNVRYFDRNNQ